MQYHKRDRKKYNKHLAEAKALDKIELTDKVVR